MKETVESYRRLPVDRVCGLTPETFLQRYLFGEGTPVIVTDALSAWKARSKWSFEWFKSRYGSALATFAGLSPEAVRVMKLGDYIDYLDAPQEQPRGFWIDARTKIPCDGPPLPPTMRLYFAWNAFPTHPELLDDIELSPRFVEDWLPFLPEAFHTVLSRVKNYFSGGLLIGPPGSGFGLHQDILHSHAYLAQIAGRKRFLLFPPESSEAVYGGKVDLDSPDLEQYPLLRTATAFAGILEPGEVLFIPSRWWHHVVGLEKTITVNYNFMNRTNFGAYLTDILQDLPAVVNSLEASPDLKAVLGIDWVCRGFDFPDSRRKV